MDCGGYLSLHGGLFHHVREGPFYSLWGGGAFFKAAIPPPSTLAKISAGAHDYTICTYLYNGRQHTL